jgi:hypothetical protein
MKINGELKLGEINIPAIEKMPALEQFIKNASISYSIEVSVNEMVQYAKALPEMTQGVMDSIKIAIKEFAECDALDELLNKTKNAEPVARETFTLNEDQEKEITTEKKGD